MCIRDGYNPNITEKEEYEKRLNEIENFVKKLNVDNIKVLRAVSYTHLEVYKRQIRQCPV